MADTDPSLTPSAPAPKPKGQRLLATVAILMAAGSGYGAGTWIARKEQGLHAKLAEAKQEFQELQQEYNTVKDRAEKLDVDYADLQGRYGAVKQERDKLAVERKAFEENAKSQIAALHEERARLIADTERLSQENKEFSARVGAAEQELQLAQKTNEKVILQRDTIQKQLARAERRTAEAQLKSQLLESQRQGQEMKRQAALAQRQARATEDKLKKAEAELAKLQTRMKQVQAEYVTLVAEKKELVKVAHGAPANVTRMAHQHERLLKETANMHYNLGVLLSKQKDYDKASKEFLKVVELRPDDADAHYNLGVIYAEHIPNRKRAMDYFRKYLQLNPAAKDAGWVKQYIASWQAWEGKERLD